MNVINFLIGLFFILMSIGYVIYRKIYKSDEIDDDSMLLADQIKINFSILIFFLVGLIMVYRELKFYF